jgi:hypothetical protein
MENNQTISARDIQSSFPPAAELKSEDQIDLSMEFNAMLDRICTLLNLSDADRSAVTQNHLILIDGILVALVVEEWSAHVKMYLDVGLPLTSHEESLHGLLLDRQANLPAPFMMAIARNPDTKRIMLLAYAPLTLDADSDFLVVDALTAAVLMVKGLREELSLAGESPT